MASNLILINEVVVHKQPTLKNLSHICIRKNDKTGKDSSIIQVQYHNAYQNMIFVLFSNEVYLLFITFLFFFKSFVLMFIFKILTRYRKRSPQKKSD